MKEEARMAAAAHEGRLDVREDEEQGVKFGEIVNLVLAAGYFRARIKGLSAFDKVVGGMTWCIEVCNEDIDIDLLFQENLTIGQKISLTEKIVAVLGKMQCPHRLEPHQIQGLDFIHVFPVVQWLVKRAIETRMETGDLVRAHSIYKFNQTHNTPEDERFEVMLPSAATSIASIVDAYGPKRRYRRTDGRELDEEELRVQSTLLEYGIGVAFFWKNLSGARASRKSSQSEDVTEEEMVEREKQFKAAMKSMATAESAEKLSANVVGSIVSLQAQEIRQAMSEYSDKAARLATVEGGRGDESLESLRHGRLMSTLRKQLDSLQTKLAEEESANETLRARRSELLGQHEELENLHNKLDEKLKELETMENDENQGILKKLRSLVALNENLKKQEQIFRAHCKEEMTRLQSNIEKLKSAHDADARDDDDDERNKLIDRHYEADKEKLQKLRLLLARKNREIAALQRKLDEAPTRAELSQYQQRFFELYNQVAAKHKETKQFYTLYNTMDDTKLYLSKEVNLLNSILDNFDDAMQSAASKQQFLKQLEGIVEGVAQNKLKLEKKKQEEKMLRDQLSDAYLDLVEKQRLYFKAVKDFKEECRRNEVLHSRLKGLRQ